MHGTAKTTRNRPCECEHDCGSKLRASRAQLDRGLYVCPCGGTMIPAAMEDAIRAFERGHLTAEQLDHHPEYAEFTAACASVQHGQSGPARALRNLGRTYRAPEEIAAERVYKARAAAAYANRLAALEAHRFGGAPESEPIPF